jgi:hypothetical protein
MDHFVPNRCHTPGWLSPQKPPLHKEFEAGPYPDKPVAYRVTGTDSTR